MDHFPSYVTEFQSIGNLSNDLFVARSRHLIRNTYINPSEKQMPVDFIFSAIFILLACPCFVESDSGSSIA